MNASVLKDRGRRSQPQHAGTSLQVVVAPCAAMMYLRDTRSFHRDKEKVLGC